jgi:hypothetical protein
MARIVVETKRIDDRGHTCISDSDSDCTAETRHDRLSSISLSDQRTIVKGNDATAVDESEHIAVRSPYIDDSTGERMDRLYYKLLLRLDNLEIKGFESRILESDDDPIEALFQYRGQIISVLVPFWYAKKRMASRGVY